VGLLGAFQVACVWNGLDWWIQDGILHDYDAVRCWQGKTTIICVYAMDMVVNESM